ncbi:MAG: hypothetical protein ACRDRP_17895 [Pseudonocardiaceae bacterium]
MPSPHTAANAVRMVAASVPYDVVATLVDDEVAAEDIASFSPSVGAAGARGAVAFARYVDEYRRSVPA